MNYDQLTALFRVEERSVSYCDREPQRTSSITIGITILLVVVLDQGPLGVLVGNFSGTLAVYAVLLAYRRTQLGSRVQHRRLPEDDRVGHAARARR